jgi:ubiquitin C
MQIILINLRGKSSVIEVEQSDSLFALKSKIEDIEGVPISNQRLTYLGRSLYSNNNLVSDYNIENEGIIHLSLYIRGGVMLKIYNPINNNTNVIDIDPSETIEDLKAQIEDIEGIPCFQQRLTYDGRVLSNNESKICSYGFHENAVVEVYQTLRYWY